jgi:hypothetical protein
MASNTITIAQITTSVTAKPTNVSEGIQTIVSQACSERSMAVESQARVASVVHSARRAIESIHARAQMPIQRQGGPAAQSSARSAAEDNLTDGPHNSSSLSLVRFRSRQRCGEGRDARTC